MRSRSIEYFEDKEEQDRISSRWIGSDGKKYIGRVTVDQDPRLYDKLKELYEESQKRYLEKGGFLGGMGMSLFSEVEI